MLSFLKIGQFLKIVGSGESKENKELTAPSYSRISEPTTSSCSTLLRQLPPNADTDTFLEHIRNAVVQKYSPASGGEGPNTARISMFLGLLRGSGGGGGGEMSSASLLFDASFSSPTLSQRGNVPSAPAAASRDEAEGDEHFSISPIQTQRTMDMEALLKDRADMIDAIDACLQEIPVEKPERKLSGNNTQMCAGEVAAPSEQMTRSISAGSWSPERPQSSPGRRASPPPLARHFDLQEWRHLLLDVVEVLIAIDATLYFEFFHRGKLQIMAYKSAATENGTGADGASSSKLQAGLSGSLHRRKNDNQKDASSREVSVELNKTIEELLNSACAIATWVMLRSVLHHQIAEAAAAQQEREEVEMCSESCAAAQVVRGAPSPAELSMPPAVHSKMDFGPPLIEWPEVVAELRKIFCKEHEYMVECILCAAFLRDDGRELMYCFIQEPKSRSVLKQALSFTYKDIKEELSGGQNELQAPNQAPLISQARASIVTSSVTAPASTSATNQKVNSPTRKTPAVLPPATASSPAASGDPAEYLSGVSLDDLNEEVEMKYQQCIANSWCRYLEDLLLLSPMESHGQQFPVIFSADTVDATEVRRYSSRTFCQLATAYFFCADEWHQEEREKRFLILEEMQTRRRSEEKISFSKLLSPTNTSVSTPAAQSVTLNAGQGQSLTEADSDVASLAPSQEGQGNNTSGTSYSWGLAVLVEIENRILNMSWTSALHKRVEHCIAARPQMLDVAKIYVEKERAAASVFNDFRSKQRALTSAVNTFLAAGLSQEALSFSRRHFTNEKREWAARKQTLFSAVRYLQSMVQLVQSQAAYQAHMSVIETVQIVIPQADLCEKMLSVLAPHPRGSFVLRFSDTRANVLRSRIYLLQEAWRSHAFMKNPKDQKYFEDYLRFLRQIRTRYREGEFFDARMERGHQLMQRKLYSEAARHFYDAVKLAKRAEVVNTRALLSITLSDSGDFACGPLTNLSFHRNIHLKVAGSGNLTTAEEHVMKRGSDNRELERLWRLAESERLLALAYVSQAENEVNAPKQRIELNNAVHYAYAAQATLQKWQAKGGTPKRMLTAYPSSLIVICKALMLLKQSKKAMLLLEPLIEEKPSSASIRPPMWGEILQPTPEPLTAEDIVLRMDVNSVTIDVYQLYTQCIVQFDEHKALRAADQVRGLLIEGDRWIRMVGEQIQQPEVSSPAGVPSCCDESAGKMEEESGEDEEDSGEDSENKLSDSIRVVLESSSERLRALRALRRGSWDICRALRDIKIATGDAYCKMKRWDEARETFEALLSLLRDKKSSSTAFTNEDLKLSSHYRASAGPSTKAITTAEGDDPTDSSSPSGLSPAWRALLYGDDHFDSLAPLDDQMLSIAQEETDDGFGKMAPGEDLVVVMAEEERVDHHAAANLIFSKLAGVYQAVGDLQTSIKYHKLVLAYSNEIKDDSLQYNSLLHLARLYTATNAQRESQDTWEKVSALAREYEDQEVCRETMRNIINAQQIEGKYFDVVNLAKELDQLAQEAEGTGAASDRRFALEALANAHLQVGQFDDSLAALDEREVVQEKSEEWTGKLFEMRAKAFIGKGQSSDAIKVLSGWVRKAKLMNNFQEIGKANCSLANAYAADHNEIKAQRCHIESIAAFAQLPEILSEHRTSTLSSARWLVHYFYLSQELVEVDPAPRKSTATPSPNTSSAGNSKHATVSTFENKSGNLSVLLSEEERRREGLPSLLKGSIDYDESAFAHSSGGRAATAASNSPSNNPSTTPSSTDALEEDTGISDSSTSTKSRMQSFESGSDRKESTRVGTLGNVSLCKRPAASALEMELADPRAGSDVTKREEGTAAMKNDTKRNADEKDEEGEKVMVSTRNCQAAIEIMEWCTQLLVQRARASLYSPSEAVDLAFSTHPNCTFVFFFAEYTTSSSGSYDILIRPARSSFFITKTALVTAIQPYREALAAVPDAKTNASGFDAELLQQLGYLYDELWHPIECGMKKAKSKLEHADCVFIIPDASLYNIPFGALISSSPPSTLQSSKHKPKPRKPLGAMYTLVVTPSLAHLVQRGMLRDGVQSRFLKAREFSRNIVLSDGKGSAPVKPESEEVLSVAKRTLFGRKALSAGDNNNASSAAAISDDEPLKALTSWTISASCTRQGMKDMFRDKRTKAIIIGSPVSHCDIRAADGVLSCQDIISHSSHSLSKKEPQFNCRHIELVVLQNNQNHHTSEENPGLPVKLCLFADCPRVLRIENIFGSELSRAHRKLTTRFIRNLEKVLRHGQDYAFALALRITIDEAWREELPPSTWGAFTLVGTP